MAAPNGVRDEAAGSAAATAARPSAMAGTRRSAAGAAAAAAEGAAKCAHRDVDRRLLLGVVVGQGAAVLEHFAGENHPQNIRRAVLLLRDQPPDVLDGARAFDAVERPGVAPIWALVEDLEGHVSGGRGGRRGGGGGCGGGESTIGGRCSRGCGGSQPTEAEATRAECGCVGRWPGGTAVCRQQKVEVDDLRLELRDVLEQEVAVVAELLGAADVRHPEPQGLQLERAERRVDLFVDLVAELTRAAQPEHAGLVPDLDPADVLVVKLDRR